MSEQHFLEPPSRVPTEDAGNLRSAALKLARAHSTLAQYVDDLLAAGYEGALKEVERGGTAIYLAGYRDMLDRSRQIGLVPRRAFDGEWADRAMRIVSTTYIDESVEREHGARDRRFENAERRDLIDTLLGTLPEKWRKVLRLYYLDGMTFSEVGAAIGVTESRVCQIRSQAIEELGKIARWMRLGITD